MQYIKDTIRCLVTISTEDPANIVLRLADVRHIQQLLSIARRISVWFRDLS